MLNEMTINSEQVRALRDARGWSQEHLAEVSGLSLRTIQRVESDGRASRETRLSLAAAFDVPLGRLSSVEATGDGSQHFGAMPLLAVGTLLVVVGLAVGANLALLMAGAAIQVAGLALYGLSQLNAMRRAAGLPAWLETPAALSGLSLLITGATMLLLGRVLWLPAAVLGGVGLALLVWHWFAGRITDSSGPARADQVDRG